MGDTQDHFQKAAPLAVVDLGLDQVVVDVATVVAAIVVVVVVVVVVASGSCAETEESEPDLVLKPGCSVGDPSCWQRKHLGHLKTVTTFLPSQRS